MIKMLNPLENLSNEVLCLSSETSEKYVPAPHKGQVLQDLLIGIKRFKNTVRWKWFWIEKARLENERTLGNKGDGSTEIKEISEQEEPTHGAQGLGTGLKRTSTANSVPTASPQVEVFLDEVAERLLTELDKSENQPETSKAKEIRRLEAKLREHPNMMVIPTNKTNSYKVIDKEKYIEWVLNHLKTDAIEVSADKLVKIHEEGNELLLKLGNTLSEKEMGFVEEMLDSRAVLTPKLLIKDHKPMNKKGEYVTRLIVPATNFTAAFPKVGYLGIKNIFDQNGIDYSGSTITQASQLKMTLEKLNITKDKVTIISFDAVRMYPSIKYKLVRKAVKFFARNLNAETQRRIDTCLEMIKFGMGNTLLTFVNKNYKYGGDLDVEDRGLTIGGYESAWLANLCMAYITDNSRDILDQLVYEGIYRDDGIAVFKGLVTTSEVAKWLGIFQIRVNNLADSKFLEFTAEVWGNDRDNGRKYKAVGTTNKDYFPFLDMEMYWSLEGNLKEGHENCTILLRNE
jgi:hypothetical protein